MEEDDVSNYDFSEDDEQFWLDEQRESLQTYFDSLPYKCESIDEMQEKLEDIISKLYLCAKAKNWQWVSAWNGMLECWLLLRYPMHKTTRAKLLRFYYELSVLPGIDSNILRTWIDLFGKLSHSRPGQRHKLEPSDLQLSWRPLWRVLQRDIWTESNKVTSGLYLDLAVQSKYYYPISEIPAMLETFLPLLTFDTVATASSVLVSFLPLKRADQYLPVLFRIWEGFNSAMLDEIFIDFAGDLSREQMTDTTGDGQVAEWKDVGIWTSDQWNVLTSKGLNMMEVPIGVSKGASTTASYADQLLDRPPPRVKHSRRINALAMIIVNSISVDGEERTSTPAGIGNGAFSQQVGYIAGSRALDTLDKFITCTESFFHPSNSGIWTTLLTTFVRNLAQEFVRRVKEEEQSNCKVPDNRRITPELRRAFVKILRIPCLLAMFSKDPISLTFAQGALRHLATLEPNIMMPDLLERAYSGLEAVNETHRTTAVLTMLSGMVVPLTTEGVWLGGQKHVVPLLELCIPGIDLNDPIKTVCATSFICHVVQSIKIGDLSLHQTGVALSGDFPPEGAMDIDDEDEHLPDGTEIGSAPRLSRQEERSLTRDSTSAFADWVTSLFRRVLSLYENLPEEGGQKGTTGGKLEETVLKSIKNMMDAVCLQLSDQLFDLVLNLVYDYATTNTKSNAVRAFGQLVACLARVKPDKTLARFLPFCKAQIEDELKHGASSIRTTSTHMAVPSDTTLHWNMSILRGCLGYGGPVLLKYKNDILDLLALLVEKTKSERGYTGTGRIITRILHTLAGVYPLNGHFVNEKEWQDPNFQSNHHLYWGKVFEAKEVVVDWHVPSDAEVAFVLELLDRITTPALDKVEGLLQDTSTWDSATRNDFCRYLHAVRATWNGLPTIYKEEYEKNGRTAIVSGIEVPELLIRTIDVQAGFTLTDPKDPRYQRFQETRLRFGDIVYRASSTLRKNAGGEDHIDAVNGVVRAIDTYMLSYGMTRSDFDSLFKHYTRAQSPYQMWSRQKEFFRHVFVKRARAYHGGRVYIQSLYRRRSELDDRLLTELAELSLSRYTRIRRQAQNVFYNVSGYFVRSTRLVLPLLYDALGKGEEPDRMKGALYVLWNKNVAAYALTDPVLYSGYLLSLLACQNEEKPSIQKLASSVASDCLHLIHEDAIQTEAYSMETPALNDALEDLTSCIFSKPIDPKLSNEALRKGRARIEQRNRIHHETVLDIFKIATKSTTHWRYVHMSMNFLLGFIRREYTVSSQLTQFFAAQCLNPQPSIRISAQTALRTLLRHIKMRTYSKSREDLWFEEWRNPLAEEVEVRDPQIFMSKLSLSGEISKSGHYFDKIPTGFLAWSKTVKGYKPILGDQNPFKWDQNSIKSLEVLEDMIFQPEYLNQLAQQWSQEPAKSSSTFALRAENLALIQVAAKMLVRFDAVVPLDTIEPLLFDEDKYKQRAGAEVWAGILRGSKHWPQNRKAPLWEWTAKRLDRILSIIKPETASFWDTLLMWILDDHDPRRHQPITDWILSLPFEFIGDSAFEMKKVVCLVNILATSVPMFFKPISDRYAAIIFNNMNINYADLREMFCHTLRTFLQCHWQPGYATVSSLVNACREQTDPLSIRRARYIDAIDGVLQQMPKWRKERLPPPRVSQSEYDKVGLTLLLYLWTVAHGAQVSLIFPYAVPMLPEILRMSELNDSSDLQTYSTAVLYVLSAVSPPKEYIEPILSNFVQAIRSTNSWRTRLQALPTVVVFFYRNILYISQDGVSSLMEVLMTCLADENVEVREMASTTLAGVVRCSQRQSIIPLKARFVSLAKKTMLPPRRDPGYADALRTLHSAILGICALIKSVPYSVEPWMPPLTEVLAQHATDPPPISTTIRECASEFKKTHQDTWHKDQLLFDEDQLQNLSTMLVGTSYYA